MGLVSRLFGKRRREEELEEEVRSHLKMAAREGVDRGADPIEAEYAAQREFGNSSLVKEATRDQWGWRWVQCGAAVVGEGGDGAWDGAAATMSSSITPSSGTIASIG